MRKKLLSLAALGIVGTLLLTACAGGSENENTAASQPAVSDAVLNGTSTVESVLYDSSTVGKQQRMQVYLPAGYDTTQDSYPVLYLINGGGTDDTAWTGGGNMQEIMDELIVTGTAKPMIVVMPDGGLNGPSEDAPGEDRGQDNGNFGGQGQNQQWDGGQPRGDNSGGNDGQGRNQGGWGNQGGWNGGGQAGGSQEINEEQAAAANEKRELFITELEQDIIPYIDSSYRTISEAKSRAVAGFSYGGAESLYAGVEHTELFNWIGVFSMGIQGGSSAGAQSVQGSGSSLTPEEFVNANSDFFADADKTNETIHLFWIAVGKDDQIISDGAQQLSETLDEYGITHMFKTTNGGHDMSNWQAYLKEFAARIFQAEPYAGTSVDVTESGSDVASATVASEDVETIYDSIIRMDTHLHVDVPMSNGQTLNDTIDLRVAMENAGMNAIGMTFAVDYVQLTEEGQAYDRFVNALTAMDKILEDNGLERTLTAAQMMGNFENGIPIVIQEVEGAHFLEGDVSRLQTAYDRGVRILDLFHDNDADPALGDVYTNAVVYGGLTELGEETLRECERLGILVDMAHASDDTVRDALAIATKPILISHTGLNTQLGNSQMAQFMLPRLISPELAKEVADAGGVIGVWPHLANTPEEYAANIKAMVDVVGIDHVTIGTDSKITPGYDERSGSFRQGSGTANHVFNDVDDNFYHSVITELVALGFTQEDIYKICGGNFLRVFEAATE